MRSTTFISLLPLLGAAFATENQSSPEEETSYANGPSSITIKNSCSYPVYLWSVGDGASEMETLDAKGGSWSEECYSKLNGGGISIKLSPQPVLNANTPLTQLEYTVGGNLFWYDLSNIDLGSTGKAPFVGNNLELVPSDDLCPRVRCPADQIKCVDAYNVWNDDHATKACAANTKLFLELCATEEKAAMPYSKLVSLAKRAPEPVSHVHKVLEHVHDRIRRSRVFRK